MGEGEGEPRCEESFVIGGCVLFVPLSAVHLSLLLISFSGGGNIRILGFAAGCRFVAMQRKAIAEEKNMVTVQCSIRRTRRMTSLEETGLNHRKTFY